MLKVCSKFTLGYWAPGGGWGVSIDVKHGAQCMKRQINCFWCNKAKQFRGSSHLHIYHALDAKEMHQVEVEVPSRASLHVRWTNTYKAFGRVRTT